MSTFFNRTFNDANQRPVPYDGSPVEWRVSAYALVVRDGHLLVIKNKSEELSDIPGGGLEPGETIEEAIQREALEEAGAHVKVLNLVSVNQDWFYHRKGRFYQALQLFYMAELVGEMGQPTEPEVEKVYWLPWAEIETGLLPTFVKAAVKVVPSF